MSNLQPNCCLKVDFQNVDQHARGKWLIHDTKRHITLESNNSKYEYMFGDFERVAYEPVVLS